MIVVGKSCILSCNGVLFKFGRNRKITINFFSLYGFPSGCFIHEILCYFKSRYGRYISNNTTGSSGIILIDNADRNIFHLSVAENSCHKEECE